ncbi:MAG: tetratricopeptide repeat protein [Magnetococcales bacterium]|nr:tetratricopeptide repeat protein [Magnetococcales bacterium]
MEPMEPTEEPHQRYARGVSAFARGDAARAAELARGLLGEFPDLAPAWGLLGAALCQLRFADAGLVALERACALEPDNPRWHHDRGQALSRLHRHGESLEAHRRALELDPGFAAAACGVADALALSGRGEEALAEYRRAAELHPAWSLPWGRQGLIHARREAWREAEASYRRAAALAAPSEAGPWVDWGNALRRQGRLDEAEAALGEALRRDPESPEGWGGRALLLGDRERWGEALAAVERALPRRASDPLYHEARGQALHHLGRREEALAAFEQALTLEPDRPTARWHRMIARLPAIARNATDPPRHRAEFLAALEEMTATWADLPPEARDRLAGAAGASLPFLLAYQGENDREPQSRFGDLLHAMVTWRARREGWHPPPPDPGPPTPRLRLGIVSAHLRRHSVWDALIKGMVARLDRERVALHLFHLSPEEDGETRWARQTAAAFIQGPLGLAGWAGAITAARPHVLLYPEPGMEPLAAQLASLRLAPRQWASWGHPETTGLPTVDAFLGADALEPPDAQDHYRERLIRLPGLGCCYHPPEILEQEAAALLAEEPEGVPRLICAHTPFKFHPRHDRLFPRIAREAGRVRFLFFDYLPAPELSERLKRRLAEAFAAEGLVMADHCRFLPWLRQGMFHGLLRRVEGALDPVGFSGFNTAMQQLGAGVPLVTVEGRFLRGRLASGILRRLGVPELIAPDEEGYVRLAARLARDGAWREGLRRRIAAGMPGLWGDEAPIRAMEQALREESERPPCAP